MKIILSGIATIMFWATCYFIGAITPDALSITVSSNPLLLKILLQSIMGFLAIGFGGLIIIAFIIIPVTGFYELVKILFDKK